MVILLLTKISVFETLLKVFNLDLTTYLYSFLKVSLFGFWLKIDKMVVERKQYIQIKVLPKFMWKQGLFRS